MTVKKQIATIIAISFIISTIIVNFLKYDLDFLLNWHSFIPDYEQREELINRMGFQYLTYLEILTYSEKDINKMIKDEIYIPIEIDEFTQLYEEYVTGFYEHKLNSEQKDILHEYINENIINENNYYMFREDPERKNRFILNILDIQKNEIYSLYTSPQ